MKWIKFTVVWRAGWILHLDTPRNKPQPHPSSLLIHLNHFLFGVLRSLTHNESQLSAPRGHEGRVRKHSQCQLPSPGSHLISHLKKDGRRRGKNDGRCPRYQRMNYPLALCIFWGFQCPRSGFADLSQAGERKKGRKEERKVCPICDISRI